jgi:hypothetical protein
MLADLALFWTGLLTNARQIPHNETKEQQRTVSNDLAWPMLDHDIDVPFSFCFKCILT